MNSKKIESRAIDELCELLGVKSAYELTKEFGVANGTLSNIKTGKKVHPITKFLLTLSLMSLRELSAKKRKEISQKMKNNRIKNAS